MMKIVCLLFSLVDQENQVITIDFSIHNWIENRLSKIHNSDTSEPLFKKIHSVRHIKLHKIYLLRTKIGINLVL